MKPLFQRIRQRKNRRHEKNEQLQEASSEKLASSLQPPTPVPTTASTLEPRTVSLFRRRRRTTHAGPLPPTVPTPPSTPDTQEASSSDQAAVAVAVAVRIPPPPPTVDPWTPFIDAERDPLVRRALEGTLSKTEMDEDFHNRMAKVVSALDRSGNELIAEGEYEAAFLRYERALVLKRSAMDAAEQDVVDQEPSAAASEYGARASIMASMATSINNMTYLKQRAGLASAEETMASYLKSLQIKRDILGPNHLSVGKTLNNIGSVFYLKHEYEPALQAYKDAHTIMESQLGAEHVDVGTVVSNIGDVHFAMGQKERALERYRSALNIRWVNLGPNDPKVVRLMNQIAGLETGEQPEREAGEHSDSESVAFEEEAGERPSLIMEEIQVLQQELKEDMKFFDLVEREMAINMLKDKMRIFREMRDMFHRDEAELASSQGHNSSTHLETKPLFLDDEIEEDGKKLVQSMVDGKPLTKERPVEEPTVETQCRSSDEGKAIIEPSQSAVSNELVTVSAPVVEPESLSDERSVVHEPSPTLDPSNLSVSSTPERDVPSQPNQSTTTTPAAPPSPVAAAVAARKEVTRSRLTHKGAHLSAEERRNAVDAVKERLARLRAEREANGEERKSSPTTKTIGNRSYMFPTAASSAKASTPIRRFLRTPEGTKTQKGIGMLRRYSETHGSTLNREGPSPAVPTAAESVTETTSRRLSASAATPPAEPPKLST